MKFDLAPLQKALLQLKKSLDYCNSSLAENDNDLMMQFRAASIQAFEYSFESCIHMLRRYLKEFQLAETIHQMAYRDLIRSGALTPAKSK